MTKTNETKNVEISTFDKLTFILATTGLNKVQTRKANVIAEKINSLYTDITTSAEKEKSRSDEKRRKLILKAKFSKLTTAELEKLAETIPDNDDDDGETRQDNDDDIIEVA